MGTTHLDTSIALALTGFDGPRVRESAQRLFPYGQQRTFSIPVMGEAQLVLFKELQTRRRIPTDSDFETLMWKLYRHWRQSSTFGMGNGIEVAHSMERLHEAYPAIDAVDAAALACTIVDPNASEFVTTDRFGESTKLEEFMKEHGRLLRRVRLPFER